MEYLHAMLRITDVDEAVRFFCEGMGLVKVRRRDSEEGRFTLIFLASPDDLMRAGVKEGFEGPLPTGLPMVELTHNWDPETMTAAAISATWPGVWPTFTPCARACRAWAIPSCGRRGTGAWRL